MKMSSVVEVTSPESSHEEEEDDDDDDERLDYHNHHRITNPTARNFSLPKEAFLKAAISLKDQVVQVTWKVQGSSNNKCTDQTIYTGLLGTAFTCLRSYQATGSPQDLLLCAEIVDACASFARATTIRHVTFLCGRGGVYAIGAVVANFMGDQRRRDLFVSLFLELAQERALPVGPEEGGFGMSYDLLYGRAGFLWAALFINKNIGEGTISNDLLMPVVEAVMNGGRAGASNIAGCPLMYRWHGTRYWGAAHGLAGILQVLLHFPLGNEDAEDVKGTLRYMMSNRFPQSGNYPSSEGNPRDKLVQWSHGASGVAMTLCKASQVFADEELRGAAVEAGEVVWKRGLVKKVGLADGVAGNAYAFLSLYRLTGESLYEERARAFAGFLYHNARDLTTGCSVGADHDYSLFLGVAGVACLWFDLLAPTNSTFPGYEL